MVHRARAATALLVALVVASCTAPVPDAPPDDASAPPTQSPVAAPPTWEATFTSWSPGVARIASTGCSGGGSGSGFLVGPDTLVTAYHVVEDATAVSVRFGADVVSGSPVAVDEAADLAIVKLHQRSTATPLQPSDTPAAVGAAVAVLGYPLGKPLGMTQGAVTAADLRVQVEGEDRWGLFRTDAAINGGNSGGPVVTVDGRVVGVVVAGSDAAGAGYAVGLPTLRASLEAWDAGELETPAPLECGGEWDALTDEAVNATWSSAHPDAPSIAQTMQLYAQSINTGYVDTVWELLTPRMHERVGSIENYAQGLSTSAWHWLDIEHVEVVDATTDKAVVSFRTTQAADYGPDGATCTDWRITYTLTLDVGQWQIDDADLTDGEPTPCSEEESMQDL